MPNLKARIPELDGIRGVAIGMILAHHYFLLYMQNPPGTLLFYVKKAGQLAWSGVDFFFVLSGFLIGGILLDVRDSSNYFRVFYTRRFFRIIPMYAVVIAGSFLLQYLVGSGTARGFAFMAENRLPLMPYLFFLQNFWSAVRSSFGDWFLAVTWSLAIEEQFYLTLPLLIRFLSPRRLPAVLIASVLAAPLLRILLQTLWPAHSYSWVVLMPCRADALLIGVLGAMIMRHPDWRARLEKNRAGLLVALLLLACGFVILTVLPANSYGSPYGMVMLTVGFTWLACFYISVLLYALVDRESWLSRCLRWRWLGWLGSIAYGAYLLHLPMKGILFGLIWSRAPQSAASIREVGMTIVVLGITLTVCHFSWYYFEGPLVKVGHRAKYESEQFSKSKALATGSAEGSSVSKLVMP